MLIRFALCFLLAVPALASGQQSILPVVTEVLDNPAGTQITINGSGFGPGSPLVTLAGTSLTVVKASDTSILASIPTSFTAGSYLLNVTNRATGLFGVFSAVIPPAVGVTGSQGPQGVQGPAGAVGVAGAQGALGPAGPQGPIGASGLAGAVGPQGPVGLQGPQGPAGANGQNGTNGAQGAQGPQGAQGMTGPGGPQGPAGAQGPSGPTGPVGPSVATQVYAANITISSDPQAGIIYGAVVGGSGGVSTSSATIPPQYAITVPNACTASNLSVQSSARSAGSVSDQVAVSFGSAELGCFLAPNQATGSIGCLNSSSVAVPAGSTAAVTLNSPANSAYANTTLLVSFTCQ